MATAPDIIKTYDTLEDNYSKYAEEYTHLNPSNIDHLLERLPVHYAFFGGVHAYAKSLYDQALAKFITVEAELSQKIKYELESNGKKATVHAIEKAVITSVEYSIAQKKVHTTNYKLLLSKNLMSSLDYAKDLLVQISANRRNETKLL